MSAEIFDQLAVESQTANMAREVLYRTTDTSDLGEHAAVTFLVDPSELIINRFANGRIEVPQGQTDTFYMTVDRINIPITSLYYRLISFLSAPDRLDVPQSYATLHREVWDAPDEPRMTSQIRGKIKLGIKVLREKFEDEALSNVKTGALQTTDLGFVACSVVQYRSA